MTTHHPIAVVGAGLGGLVLANVLHRNGTDVALYDLDAAPDARGQGGMLDMHVETGQAALRAAGLYEDFRRIIQPGGQEMRVLDMHGSVLHHDPDEGERPEVHRGDLRAILLSRLPREMIHWGAKVARARSLGGGRHEVTLAGGGSFTTDLLIGADGAWSRVRRLVSDATPDYCGISFLELTLPDAERRHPDSAALVGGGSMFALAPGKGILGHRTSGDLHLAAALTVDEGWLDAVDVADAAGTKALLLAHFSDWAPSLRRLIADADDAVVPRRIHALPAGHRWERVPGVTLLGDAAHLMSPFAGEGANVAMLDGARLAGALRDHPDDPERALAAYERDMFPRAETAAAQSMAGTELCFGPETPAALVAMFGQAPPRTAETTAP